MPPRRPPCMTDRSLLYAAAFVRALATGMIGVLMGVYLARLEFTPAGIGSIVGAGLLGCAGAALLVTCCADRRGRSRVVPSEHRPLRAPAARVRRPLSGAVAARGAGGRRAADARLARDPARPVADLLAVRARQPGRGVPDDGALELLLFRALRR